MTADISKEKAEAVFRENSAYVYRVALFLTKSKALADDITQETFLQVFRKYEKFDVSKSIQPWIYKITLNTTRNMLRKHRWLHFVGEVPETTDVESIENTYIKSEEAKKLWEEINKLTLKSREVIVLHFYCSMKLKEIADIIDIPVGTCKSRLNQGLKVLRTNLPENDILRLSQGGDIYEPI